MKKLLGLAVLLAGTACSAGQDNGAGAQVEGASNVFMANDFESLRGWVDATGIDAGHAHSGKYASKVDRDREFGVTYEMALGKISDHKMKTLHLEAWVYLPSTQAATVGFKLVDPAQHDQTVFGDGIKLEDVKTFNQWVRVEKDIVLPDNINSALKMRVFLWRGGANQAVYLDDIKMSIKQ